MGAATGNPMIQFRGCPQQAIAGAATGNPVIQAASAFASIQVRDLPYASGGIALIFN